MGAYPFAAPIQDVPRQEWSFAICQFTVLAIRCEPPPVSQFVLFR